MGGGIMDIVPREQALLGGVKKAIKKAGKGVKKVASSDAGKAALYAAAAWSFRRWTLPGGIQGSKLYLVGLAIAGFNKF